MNIFTQAIILSGELSTLNDYENLKRTINLGACLEDCNFKFKKCLGVYKGTSEVSFLVVVKNEDDIQIIKDFAFKSFNQESILLQDANGLCTLEYNNGKIKALGKFQRVNSKFIEQYESYTVLDGEIFVTVRL